MKRNTLLLIVALLALPSLSFAGGACVLQEVGGNYIYQGQMLFECTASSTDASMSHTFDGTHSLDAITMALLDGRYVKGALAYDGAGTDPTTNTSLTVTDSDGFIYVNPASNGLEVIDSGGKNSFYFLGPDGNAGFRSLPGGKPLTFAWNGNLVNSGVHYLLLDVTVERNAR